MSKLTEKEVGVLSDAWCDKCLCQDCQRLNTCGNCNYEHDSDNCMGAIYECHMFKRRGN